jgi:hypothetical protein
MAIAVKAHFTSTIPSARRTHPGHTPPELARCRRPLSGSARRGHADADADALCTLVRTGARPTGSRGARDMATNPYVNDEEVQALFVWLRSLHRP